MSDHNLEQLHHLPLPALYSRCEQLAAGSISKPDPQLAVEAFHTCAKIIDSQRLFSSNEDLDDIPTSHLRYLLLPHLFAQFLSNSTTADLELRKRSLQQAIESYSELLRRCESYSLLGEVGRSCFAREEDGGVMDPNSKRMAKIERFKREKAIDAALQRFERVAAFTNEKDEDGLEAGPTGGPRGLDEEDEREMWCLKLERAVLQALGQRESLKQEIELLHHAADRARRSQGASSSQGREQQWDDPEMMKTRKAMMAKLSSITDALTASEGTKQKTRQDVFKPYHTLPTMTVEQAGEIEWKQAMEAEQRAKAAEAQKPKKRDDSDDEEEVMRQRAWDDWKDDNPRGMGNSKLRPTA